MQSFAISVTVIIPFFTLWLLHCFATELWNDEPGNADLDYLSGRNGDGLKTLRLVQFIHRHGLRNQKKANMELSPLFKQSPPMDSFEQLTETGKAAMFSLGQVLQRRYNGFLERAYDMNQILVQSKDSDRCIQSAQALLLGLFPEVQDDPGAPAEYNFVPVHSISDKVDNILDISTYPCPRLRQLDAEDADRSERRYGLQNRDLFEYMSQTFGTPVNSIVQLTNVFIGWALTVQNGIPVPANESMYVRAEALVTRDVLDKMESKEEQELSLGPLFTELMDRASEVVDNLVDHVPRRAYEYSTGINPIIYLISVLQLEVLYKLPSYGATLIFELHEKPGKEPFMQFFFRNRTDAPPFELISAACGTPCTLVNLKNKFAYLLNVTQNYDERCVAKPINENATQASLDTN